MAVLTGPEIKRRMSEGDIVIDPCDLAHVGPNSVDLHLGDRLLVYDPRRGRRIVVGHEDRVHWAIDSRNLPPAVPVPEEPSGGWLIEPGRLYLGRTREKTETHGLVPYIDGRSSLGRLGVSCHVTAGRGDVGFCGTWTLEIFAVEPVIIYPGGRYFQVTFHEVAGDLQAYGGRYQGQIDPTASRINE